jgi:hypothetical protein
MPHRGQRACELDHTAVGPAEAWRSVIPLRHLRNQASAPIFQLPLAPHFYVIADIAISSART